MTEFERMRIVVFGSSIVSDWRNPIATSARPILAELMRLGHDSLFLEERNNPWLVGMLKTRGMAPARAFDAVYPGIQHRTYDWPRGFHRTVAFAQHVGTADAVLALPGTPDGVLEEIGAFRSPSVVRAVYFDAGSIDAEVKLGPVSQSGCDATFGPAVAKRTIANHAPVSLALVAYDQPAGAAAAEALADIDPILLDQAGNLGGAWRYLPEVRLPDRFEEFQTVVVAGDWREPLTWACLLLPMASGCRVVATGIGAESLSISGISGVEDVSRLPGVVRDCLGDSDFHPLPDRFDASRQAVDLLSVLRRVHDEKRRARR